MAAEMHRIESEFTHRHQSAQGQNFQRQTHLAALREVCTVTGWAGAPQTGGAVPPGAEDGL